MITKKNILFLLGVITFFSTMTDASAGPHVSFWYKVQKNKIEYCSAWSDESELCQKLKGVDIKSFHTFDANDTFGRDKFSVYFVGKKIEGADPATFDVTSKDYPRDAHTVFYYVQTQDAYLSSYIGMDATGGFVPIAGADPNSFVVISWMYSQDDQHAYYRGRQIAGAEALSFQVLCDVASGPVEGDCPYSRDKTHAYYMGRLINGADPDSFKAVVPSDYNYDAYITKDKKSVYCKTRPIPGADPDTFKALDSYEISGYYQDKNAYYYQCIRLPGDTVLDRGYSKKGNKIFYLARVVRGIDSTTFKVDWNGTDGMSICGEKHADSLDANACYLKGILKFRRK